MLAYKPVSYRLAVTHRVLRQAPRDQYQLAKRFEQCFRMQPCYKA